jgi:thioredoxin-related protein
MNHSRLWTVLLSLALASCARLGLVKSTAPEKPVAKPFGETGIPPWLRNKTPEAGTPVLPGGNVSARVAPQQITPQEDIVYTDPDDPDGGIPELSTLLSENKRGPWEESETIAKSRSTREGKPLLIWFTDSQTSPLCASLTKELFADFKFGNWATEKLIRLKIDAAAIITDETIDLGAKEDRRSRIITYNKAIKERYKVMGYPTLIMLSPSGAVLGRYIGYKRGQSEFLWGQLKHAEAVSTHSYQEWRTGLEKRDYREWQDLKGRKLFAKLTSYSKGKLTFIEPDGARSQTHESHLSEKDRAWISEQKKLRKMKD